MQELLAGLLRDAGFEVTLLGRTRASARTSSRACAGTADGPTLCLLSHVDTVLATRPSGSATRGRATSSTACVWGRGALDMKSQTAAEVVAAVSLAREGWRPARGDLLVVCGRRRGDRRHRRRDLALRAPSRARALRLPRQRGRRRGDPVRRRRASTASASPRRASSASTLDHARRRRRTRAIPQIGDNALLKLAPLLEAMASASRRSTSPRGRCGCCATSASTPTATGAALAELRARDPRLAMSSSRSSAYLRADDGRGVGEDQRVPVASADQRRLPHAAGHRRGRRARAASRRCSAARRLRAPLHRAHRRQRVARRSRR